MPVVQIPDFLEKSGISPSHHLGRTAIGVEFIVVFPRLGNKKLGIIERAMRKQQC
jgi:hypothetical protein